MCKTRRPFDCARTGKRWPEGTFARRPARNPKNRCERIAVDGLLGSRSVASIVAGRPPQQRLVKALILAGRPMKLSALSHRAALSRRMAMRAFGFLLKEGLATVVDDADDTTGRYQRDGTRHEDWVIDFRSGFQSDF